MAQHLESSITLIYYLIYAATSCVLKIQSDCDVINIWRVWVCMLIPQSHQQPVFTGEAAELDSLQSCSAVFGVAHLSGVIVYAKIVITQHSVLGQTE